MSPIDILIADDHELVRRGLISLVRDTHPDWQVVADVATGTEAIDRGVELRPNVAILDLSLPDITGLQVAERLMQSVPHIKIVVLTMHSAAPIFHQLKRSGVNAYLIKNEAPTILVTAIERVLAGEPFFASRGAMRSIDEVEAPDFVPAQFLLTPRELEVMRLLALGKSNKELASELSMSVRTAETHHANVLAKLRVDSLGEVVRIAIRDSVI
jgi:DNA-binding NarL/FixJ family response regulator